MKESFNEGKQPCKSFTPQEEGHFGGAQIHTCYGFSVHDKRTCYSAVSFCKNCFTDHHMDGYETCKLKPKPE